MKNDLTLPEDVDAIDETGAEQVLVRINGGGVRADKAIADAVPQLSRNRVQQLIDQECIHYTDGTPVKSAAAKLADGTELTILMPEIIELDLKPENIPLDIIYEDDDLLVINKPAGMSVHPAPGHWTGTLVHALLHHCGESLSGIGGVARPGIVHRIDKDTTGLLVVAKNDETHRHLSEQLAARTLSRRYAALVWGNMNPVQGTVNAALGRNPKQRQEMAVVNGGRHAVTHYTVREQYNGVACLVECQLETGRTHQIRVHMKHIGHPLLGDATYGGRTHRSAPPQAIKALDAFPRQALHAFELTLVHPRHGKKLRCEAPLPDDMQALMAALR